jgi:hypothetical protein
VKLARHDGAVESWIINSIGPIGLPKRRRNIQEVRT